MYVYIFSIRICREIVLTSFAKVAVSVGREQRPVFLAQLARLQSKYLACPFRSTPLCHTSSKTNSISLLSEYYSQCLPGGSGGGAVTTTAGNSQPTGGSGNSASGLDGKFKARGKIYFGAEIDNYNLNNAALTNIVKKDFGQVTCENSMKWDATERELPS